MFFSNENDVIKVNVEDLNGNLTQLNKLVKSNFEYQNDYPDYKPHITIAYAKKRRWIIFRWLFN